MPGRHHTGPDAPAHDFERFVRLNAMDYADLRRQLTGAPQDALELVETAARAGLAAAHLRLGRMLLEGRCVPRDAARALACFRRAAVRGDGEALNMVGRCLENGWGAPRDEALAAGWYDRADAAGCPWGAYNLANLLFDGRGVPKDLQRAARLYASAADEGHARAMNLLGRCLEEGWGVARDGRRAALCYERAARAGYFRAQFNHAAVLAAAGDVEGAAVWFSAALEGAFGEDLESLHRALAAHPVPRLAALASPQGGRP